MCVARVVTFVQNIANDDFMNGCAMICEVILV